MQKHNVEIENSFQSNLPGDELKIKILTMCFPGDAVIKSPPANARDTRDAGSIPGLERSPGIRNVNTLQYSCLENSRNRGIWWATVHGVTESDMTEHNTTLECDCYC